MQIESHFSYYWANDRIAFMDSEQDYLHPLPMRIKNQIMNIYLFKDVFISFPRFFSIEQSIEQKYLFDISLGLMPRKFEVTKDDQIIYDEEDDVPEMYFITSGIFAIGYSLNVNGTSKHQFMVSKKEVAPFLICDYYVMKGIKSEFIYMAHNFEVTAYALSRKFLVANLISKYPQVMANIERESKLFYMKNIFNPVNEDRLAQIQIINKQSVYKDI